MNRNTEQGRTVLDCIRDSVQKYADVLSTVLEMDVDIVDNLLIRVAGSGRFEKNIGNTIQNEGDAFRQVLKTGTALIVEAPGEDDVCRTCVSRGQCGEHYEICCPIALNESVIGIISLALFDEAKKPGLLQKSRDYLSFLEQIASLIAVKAAEYLQMQEHAFSLSLHRELLNHISDGVIVFDSTSHILLLNPKAEQVLGNTCNQLRYLQKINQFSLRRPMRPRQDDRTEYLVKMRDKEMSFLGQLYPILVDGQEKGSVFVFQNFTLLSGFGEEHSGLDRCGFSSVIGRNPLFVQARRNVNVVIRGETGSGKEVFARAIHAESGRAGNFYTLRCCEFNADTTLLWEDSTDIGCLFLDEICDLPLAAQERVTDYMQRLNAKGGAVIASTSRDLNRAVEIGMFRPDLFYSLLPFRIDVPAVRNRPDDIPLLIAEFLDRFGRLEGRQVTFDNSVMDLFIGYRWPGNVRQIEKTVELIVKMQVCDTRISVCDLPRSVTDQLSAQKKSGDSLVKAERKMILDILGTYGTSVEGKQKAAAELGISVATLYRKMHKYHLFEDSTLYQSFSI